jgi:Protein of unknown function (DUF2721)
MSAETVTRTIQLILAPVVMLSACSIFVGGLLSHYAALNARIRMLAHERLDLLRGASDADRLVAERLAEIDVQLPELLRRHGLVHHALLAAYLGVLILVASMCVIAFSAAVDADWLVSLVLALFVSGLLAVLASVVLISLEVRTSQRAIAFEVQRVLHLGREAASVTYDPSTETALITSEDHR